MQHVAGGTVFFYYHSDGLLCVAGRIAQVISLSVRGERSLELIRHTEAIHEQPAACL
jgi:hypothetical protein